VSRLDWPRASTPPWWRPCRRALQIPTVSTLTDIELTATRPAPFFRDDGSMPETVTLKIHRPRAFADLGQEEWAKKVRDLVQAKEGEAHQRRIRDGKMVLGVQRILAQDPFARPKSHAPHFRLSPRLAARNK
jgi:hypothetical protein